MRFVNGSSEYHNLYLESKDASMNVRLINLETISNISRIAIFVRDIQMLYFLIFGNDTQDGDL